jgi:hypothetical protein
VRGEGEGEREAHWHIWTSGSDRGGKREGCERGERFINLTRWVCVWGEGEGGDPSASLWRDVAGRNTDNHKQDACAKQSTTHSTMSRRTSSSLAGCSTAAPAPVRSVDAAP